MPPSAGSGVGRGRRRLSLLLTGAVVAALLLVARAPATETPAQREARLEPHWRLLRPEGAGPHPAAILLSGCDGVHDNMDYWARSFAESGRAALILDSHTPRGLDGEVVARAVCAAGLLRGATRAGDVAVALAALARDPAIDAGDVVILGTSHGGWTAMEFVARTRDGAPPPGLSGWPEDPALLRARVSALVLLYPYCGRLNGAGEDGWQGAPPTLMLLSEKDSVVSTPACLRRAAALGTTGAVVTTEVLPGADHGFDQRDLSVFSHLSFDAALRDQVRATVLGWLTEDGARRPVPPSR